MQAMEQLSLHDIPPAPNSMTMPQQAQPPPGQLPAQTQPQPPPSASGSGGVPQQPPPIPQLPPQMFTTAASLLDLTDKKLLVSLRDGRKVIGVLRSWDQFGNLILQDSIERLFAAELYCDIQRGLFLVRGENVVLMGEIDLDKDDYIPPPYREAPAEQVFEIRREEEEKRKSRDRRRTRGLKRAGFEGGDGGLLE